MNVKNPFTFKLVEVEVDKILPQKRQPVNEKKVQELMDSISAEGLKEPIFINEFHFLLDGMHRYNAYKRLEIPTIECKMVICANEQLFFQLMKAHNHAQSVQHRQWHQTELDV